MGGGKPSERERGEFLMADYLVTDTELTSVAAAIRAKTGRSAALSFPAEFISEIGSISGGGTSPFTKIITSETAVTMTSSTATAAFTLELGSQYYTKDKIIWVHIRDKAGARSGYFYGSDAFFVNANAKNGGTTTFSSAATVAIRYSTGNQFAANGSGYGVYGYSISSDGRLTVRKRYSSSSSLTIDGTYVTTVYAIDLPSGITLFP